MARPAPDGITRERNPVFFVPVTAWVIAAFALSTVAVGALSALLIHLSVRLDDLDQNVSTTVLSAAIYVLLLLITLGVPRLLKLWSSRIGYRRLIGLTQLPRWRDILTAIVGFVVYLALGVGVTLVVQALIPGFNGSQAQDIGFSKTLGPNSALLVFFTLVVVAPVAEEVIFRGYLFGTLRRTVPLWASVLITSLVFGAVHLQWNVGLDVFVMSLVSCVLRYRTGSLWASILLHMMKNGLAFYVLYIASNSIM